MARAEHVQLDVSMKCPAECSSVSAAVRSVLFVGNATGARFTVWEAAREMLAATGKRRPGGVIRRPPVAAPCTSKEIAVTGPG